MGNNHRACLPWLVTVRTMAVFLFFNLGGVHVLSSDVQLCKSGNACDPDIIKNLYDPTTVALINFDIEDVVATLTCKSEEEKKGYWIVVEYFAANPYYTKSNGDPSPVQYSCATNTIEGSTESCWNIETRQVKYNSEGKITCKKVCQVDLSGCNARSGENLCPADTNGGTLDSSKSTAKFASGQPTNDQEFGSTLVNYHIHCYRHDDKLACHVLYGDAIYSGNDDNAKHEAGSESIGNYGSRNDDSRSFNGRHDGFPDHPILHYKENIRVDYSDPEQTPRAPEPTPKVSAMPFETGSKPNSQKYSSAKRHAPEEKPKKGYEDELKAIKSRLEKKLNVNMSSKESMIRASLDVNAAIIGDHAWHCFLDKLSGKTVYFCHKSGTIQLSAPKGWVRARQASIEERSERRRKSSLMLGAESAGNVTIQDLIDVE
eukprot:g7109.t1